MKICRNNYIIIISLILFSYSLSLNAKEPKPFKTGLVLSGGGAKGLAHIGLLQIIDSLDIQIDYLTGTSMGSIVGALYASGYSGDSINSIIDKLDWDYTLSNRIPLQKVHITAKDSYGKSMAAVPFKKGFPILPKALIEGQFMTDEMNRLLFHTRNTNDFSKLPIPLKIIATDILSGKTIRLGEGSIPLSIRASMAIPVVFTPVHLNNYLLVDGGVTRNFPVEEVREMGADIVIGSYTGMRIRSKEEINSPLSMISQVFAFEAVTDAEQQKKITDITLEMTKPLANFQTQSFSEYKSIIAAGKAEAYRILPDLIELKQKQEVAGIKRQRKVLSSVNIPIRKINTYNQEAEPLSEDEDAIFQTILTEEGLDKLDNYDFLQKKISKIYSLDFYSKIYYTFSNNNDSTKDLNIFVKPVERELRTSLHFDTYESAGIIFKYNQNSLWLPNSKFSFAFDLSAYPKINISYLKFLNTKLNFWGKVEYDRRVQSYNNLSAKLISQAMFHTSSNLKNTNDKISLLLGYAPTTNSAFTLNGTYLYDKLNKENGVFTDLLFIEDATSDYSSMYNHKQIALELKYDLNTLNSSYYPTRGLKLNTTVGWLHNLNYSFHVPPESDEFGTFFYKFLNPKIDNRKIYNNVFQASIDTHWALALNKQLSLQTYMFAGMNFVKRNNQLDFVNYKDYLFISQMYTVGGYNNYDYKHQVPFAGLGVNEIYGNGIFSLTGALQWNVWKKLYLLPRVSMGQVLNHPTPFSEKKLDDWLFGLGIDVDYLTPLGPIKFGFGINNQVDVLIGFLSLGYQF